jgi:hypothetical protein
MRLVIAIAVLASVLAAMVHVLPAAQPRAGATAAGAQSQPSLPPPDVLFRHPVVSGLAALRAPDRDTRERGTRDLTSLRQSLIEALLQVIDPRNVADHGEDERIRAAYLLGEYRAAEAVPMLVELLQKGEWGPSVITDLSPYDAPLGRALRKIGLPAVPALVESLRSAPTVQGARSAANVLFLILADRVMVMRVLEKAESGASPQQLERLKEAQAWAAARHFEGNRSQ